LLVASCRMRAVLAFASRALATLEYLWSIIGSSPI
jgi:hypothetical protein